MTPAVSTARTARADILRDMSAREIAALITRRELSATEVMGHFAARVGAVNGRLNAVAVDLTESARKAAADVDAALARGEKLGPLAGLPVTIKRRVASHDQGMF
jgi:amidase